MHRCPVTCASDQMPKDVLLSVGDACLTDRRKRRLAPSEELAARMLLTNVGSATLQLMQKLPTTPTDQAMLLQVLHRARRSGGGPTATVWARWSFV